jgi:hypothetical protein
MKWNALLGLSLLASLSIAPAVPAQEPTAAALERAYGPEIRPLVVRYCQECHAGERIEAELDLAGFAGWKEVRQHPQAWQKVGEMLDSGQMPPKDARLQPTEAERARLQQWVHSYLKLEAQQRAGDPGRVVLRRLSNAEYTHTLRDLTGVNSLDPAREFPVDGAAGEGFTNTGNALVMSPALVTKYLDAAKEVADHAVLLPDGFRFSPHTTSRDWTEDTLARIRGFYRLYTDASGGDKVNLQGIVFDTNAGGRLPLELYFAASLAERESLTSGRKTFAAVAHERGLNAKYLATLWASLTRQEPSLLLDGLRARWRAAKPEEATALAQDVAAWQHGLWRFGTVGHIGKVNGPKAWLEPVNPLIAKQDVRFKIPSSPDGQDVTVSLVASDAGDGNTHDFVVWQQPRLVAPGRPDLLLRDVRAVTGQLAARRQQLFAQTTKFLGAAAEAAAVQGPFDLPVLAQKHGVDAGGLRAWLDYLGIASGGTVELKGHFTTQIANAGGYDFVQGWGSHDTPLLLANSSDQHVRVPGNMAPHSVAVHPAPKVQAAVGWRSPVAAKLEISATVTHAHPECGNGVSWSLELRRGATRQRLATGIAHGPQPVPVGPLKNITVQPGDLVSLLIAPRDGNHSCDLTAIEFKLAAEDGPTWSLSGDVSGNILAGNPHTDRQGNAHVWHFYTEPVDGNGENRPVIPAGSLLAKWQQTTDAAVQQQLAQELQALFTSTPPAIDSPDGQLSRQLTSLGGPLFSGLLRESAAELAKSPVTNDTAWGLDPATFGKHPDGHALDAANLCVRAPSVISLRLPADLVAGCELVTTALLDPQTAAEGSVQVDVVAGTPQLRPGLLPSTVNVSVANGVWTSDNRRSSYAAPILVQDGSAARRKLEAALDDYRQLFPAALCYTKIVPVDEVVTLTLFYREDDHLMRLMLDEPQRQELNRLWDELHFVSHDALTLVDAFAQLMEYATQDADPKVFEPMRKPILDRAAAFQQLLLAAEPKHLEALLDFAGRAYRRPLLSAEADELRQLYARLRGLEIPHDEAFRLTLARVLVSPAFLYRIEKPGPGTTQSPVNDWELANRLSYFLWSSQPDDELRQAAASGQLHDPDVLVAQTHRLLAHAKTRRLATEFACQWLHIHGFDQLDEKSERHFPTFAGLRGAMYEESIQFFTDLFQHDGSVLDILAADYTFLNADLAQHYGIPGVTGPEWRRVDGVQQYARGGILAQATTLATQSGASRTSPILRGNWISEVLLGERLPRPPKDVPVLPDDEAATEGLTVRQLVERHASDAKCAVCHRRIDPLGFSLESFDAIGRRREKDLGDRAIDTRVQTMDGVPFDGLDGLRNYLLTNRRDAFVRQFCRKLLGYALGRSVQLSDELLLAEMQATLRAHEYRVVPVIETIVRSRQFREIRSREMASEE